MQGKYGTGGSDTETLISNYLNTSNMGMKGDCDASWSSMLLNGLLDMSMQPQVKMEGWESS